MPPQSRWGIGLSGVRLNSTTGDGCTKRRRQASRARRSWVGSRLPRPIPPPWKSITTGGGLLEFRRAHETQMYESLRADKSHDVLCRSGWVSLSAPRFAMATKAARALSYWKLADLGVLCCELNQTNSWVVGSSGGRVCAPGPWGDALCARSFWPSVFGSIAAPKVHASAAIPESIVVEFLMDYRIRAVPSDNSMNEL